MTTKYLHISMRLFTSLAILTVLAMAITQTSAASDPAAETPAVESFIFAAAGDHNNGTKAIASLDSIALSGADFYLALGDMSYDNVNPESMWCDLVKAHVGATFPFELISGNHEANNFDGLADGLIENYAACLPDRLGTIVGEYSREYYFDYPATNPLARFILISPDLTFTNSQHYVYDVGTTHYDWLASTIDAARTANIPWVVVGMHKVCITVGVKTCAIGTDLMNLLISKRVDLVLQAHDHGYQRSKQLNCIAVITYDPACVVDDGSDNSYTQGNGPVFVIAGMFGAGLETFNAADSEAGYFVTWMAANQNLTNGYMKYTVSDAAIGAQFVDTSGGGYSDNFTIVKSSVTLTPSSTPTPTPFGLTTITSQVASSADDAEEEVANGSMNLVSSDLELSVDGTASQWVGLRFANITVPKGATVLNAHVEFEVDETGSDPTSLTIQGQAADNALAFTSVQSNVSSRARTATQVAWVNVPVWTVTSAKWQTPDLSTIIQEIVNRPGWTPGNAMAIIISGSGRRTAEAYDGEIPAAARLVITYVYGTPTTVPSSTPTWTATPSHTPTLTQTPTVSPTATHTTTATDTPTPSDTPTETLTPPPTETATPSPLPMDTPTASLTPSPSPMDTATLTATPSPLPTYTSTSSPTATFTATSTPSRLPANTPTASPTSNDAIFANGFESGNLAAWSSSITDASDLNVSNAAALIGSYGLQAVMNDNNSIYLTDDTPNAEPRYRLRFYFDPNTITMSNNDAHYILYGYTGTSTLVLRIELRFSKGVYQLRAALRNDSNSWTSSSWFALSDAAHFIELDWRASSASGANNGGLTLWIDGSQRAALTGVDNDTRRIDRVQLGAVSDLDSGTRGAYYFDQFESRRLTYIGP